MLKEDEWGWQFEETKAETSDLFLNSAKCDICAGSVGGCRRHQELLKTASQDSNTV